MKLIMYESENQSNLSPVMYAAGMRLGYLLGDNLLCGGYYFSRYTTISRGPAAVPAKLKLDLLLKWDTDADIMETIKEVEIAQKALRKIKHKNVRELTLERRAEDLVKYYFDELWFEEYKSDLYDKGFMKLPKDSKILMQEIFMSYHNKDADPEVDGELYEPMSRLMMRYPFNNPSPEGYVPLLPTEFFNFDPAKQVTVSADDAAAGNAANIWLTQCLSFPNVVALTENEMMALRRLTNEKASPLRAAVRAWDMMFGDGADAAARRQFFTEHVAVAAEALQQAYNEAEILQQLPQQNNAHRFEVYFGEVPASLMWQFYRHMGVIKDKTWDVLQQKLQENESTPQRYPVMAYKYIPPEEGESVNDLTATTKKFIAID